ncbi:unnamed protein product, partial [Rotaria sp. Silwood2]
IRLTNRSSTATRSLDRQSSKRMTQTTFVDQHKKSLPIIKRSELLSIENAYSRSNYSLSNNKTNSTPLLQQLSKNQSFDSENERQVSSKSLPINEQQQNKKPIINKNTVSSVLLPVISSTTTEQSNPIQQEIGINSSSHHDEKSITTEENLSFILPPMVPVTTTEKPNSIVQETHENSTSNRIKDLPHESFDYPVRHLRSNTDSQPQCFNFTSFASKSIPRTKSEQIISINKSKHEPFNSKIPKLNLLALSYLFNRRMVDAELAPTSSSDDKQSQRKTVWN